MKTQNEIILSIGTNLGNKLENLQLCVNQINTEIATVVKVSSVFETEAWGFEAPNFNNCVVIIHTHKTALKILQQVLKLEKSFGRKKSKNGYESRIIDIDIIAFNEEIIDLENLKIPHVLMKERNFVLFPLQEISENWVHPKFKVNISQLISKCPNKSKAIIVGKLKNPNHKIAINALNYLAIEGNIGAGKTTLVTKMAEDFNAKYILERFADNPFLAKFYKDQNRYAFPLEMSFLADRYQQLTSDLSQFDLFKDFVVADYHNFKSLIFAKVTLQEDEFRLYKMMFDIIYKELPKPDLYVYLYQNTNRLLANIKKRGRSYEKKIPAEYLEKINQGYLDYIKTQTNLNVLIIDVSELDFVKNQQDYIFILEQINNKITE